MPLRLGKRRWGYRADRQKILRSWTVNLSVPYNVSYEAISFLCKTLGARKIGISHLSGSGRFHKDMATCHTEALSHFCHEFPDFAPESFLFCGCCIEEKHFLGAQTLVRSGIENTHHPIKIVTSSRGQAKIITIDWSPL